MSIQCKDITGFIEKVAPRWLAEDWDNVGLLVGNKQQQIHRVLSCLDVTDRVVNEAVEKKVDLIVSHHPFIFKGMKQIHEHDTKGRILYQLIKHDIGVYSSHTNLDVAEGGLNEYLAQTMSLTGIQNLNPYKTETLHKVVVFVPEEKVEDVRGAMCNFGAGWIGNYSDCTFMARGTGTFKPLDGTNPYIGTQGKLEEVSEIRLETVVPQARLQAVLQAMKKAHPYEEVAYDVYTLGLEGKPYGLGKTGILEKAQSLEGLVRNVKEKLNVPWVRVIGSTQEEIKKVAVFCGSFDGNVSGLLKQKVDVLITGDLKYHTSLDMQQMGLCAIDAGHFATERIIVPRMKELLAEEFPQLEVICSHVEEDPFKYI